MIKPERMLKWLGNVRRSYTSFVSWTDLLELNSSFFAFQNWVNWTLLQQNFEPDSPISVIDRYTCRDQIFTCIKIGFLVPKNVDNISHQLSCKVLSDYGEAQKKQIARQNLDEILRNYGVRKYTNYNEKIEQTTLLTNYMQTST